MKKSSYSLDLSALAYPMMRSRRAMSNFRFSARMDGAVDPALLERALGEVLPHYPNLKSEVVPSLFWHKLRESNAPLLVKEDDRPPLTPFTRADTNGYPFRLAYKGEEIVLEIFHAVTDGNVGALFMTDLLTRYVDLSEGREPRHTERSLSLGDPFLAYARKKSLFKVSIGKYDAKSAVPLGRRGNYLPAPTLLSRAFPLAEIKAAAASWGATLTEYVTACYIAAIAQSEPLPLRKPLSIFLPVDLRRFFPSNTLQNFVCFERITFEKGESDFSFPRLIAAVRARFAERITRENMQEHVDDVKLCFDLPLLKYFPLFLKMPLFKLIKKLTNRVRQTAILSNIGRVSLPPEIAKRVLDFKFFLNIGRNAPLNVAILSQGEVCRIDLTCGLKETGIPDRFFSLLASQGKK